MGLPAAAQIQSKQSIVETPHHWTNMGMYVQQALSRRRKQACLQPQGHVISSLSPRLQHTPSPAIVRCMPFAPMGRFLGSLHSLLPRELMRRPAAPLGLRRYVPDVCGETRRRFISCTSATSPTRRTVARTKAAMSRLSQYPARGTAFRVRTSLALGDLPEKKPWSCGTRPAPGSDHEGALLSPRRSVYPHVSGEAALPGWDRAGTASVPAAWPAGDYGPLDPARSGKPEASMIEDGANDVLALAGFRYLLRQ